MLTKILVPLDGSELAERALEYAQMIVSREGLIVLISVIDTPEYSASLYYPAGLPAFEFTRQQIETDLVPQAEDYLLRKAEDLRRNGFRVETQTIVGEPASIIIEQGKVREADAIVMSTHGRSGFSRWLFGSVANKVIGNACRPVFVIPANARKPDEG